MALKFAQTTGYNFKTGPIKRANMSSNVRTFRDNPMSQHLTWRLIDGLYDRTILKKIIQKYCFSIVPSFYNIKIEDPDGERLTDMEKEVRPLNAVIDRTFLQSVVKSFFLYGTAIVYTGDKTGNLPNDLFLLHPQDLSAHYETTENYVQRFIGFDYVYENEIWFIPLQDVALLANDPGINEIFGNSILNHVVDTLNEFLNNKLGLAEILDRYAIPLVQWTVDVSESGVLSQDEIIEKTREALLQDLQQGDDIVSDSRVEGKIIEFSQGAANLIGILQEARKDIGMLTIPESLMGGSISNLSGGKTQQSVFYEEIKGYQAILNDFVVKEFYEPFLEAQGYTKGEDYGNIYITFPLATSELPSDSIIWLKSAFEATAIDIDEFRANLGFRGKAPGVTPELEDYYEAKSNKPENQTGTQDSDESKLEPVNKDGRDPKVKADKNKDPDDK